MSLLFFSFRVALLSFLIYPIYSTPTNSSSASNRNNASATSLLATGRVSCLRRIYGYDLNYESCHKAWKKIPRSYISNTYGTRGQDVEMRVPIRYQSDDGRCVIDIRPTRTSAAVRGDVVRGVDMSNAAIDVLDRCVTKKEGGSVNGFSMQNLYPLRNHEEQSTLYLPSKKLS